MGIRRYKPTTPGRRGASGSDYSEVTRSRPEKALTKPVKSSGGRNSYGRTTALNGLEDRGISRLSRQSERLKRAVARP